MINQSDAEPESLMKISWEEINKALAWLALMERNDGKQVFTRIFDDNCEFIMTRDEGIEVKRYQRGVGA